MFPLSSATLNPAGIFTILLSTVISVSSFFVNISSVFASSNVFGFSTFPCSVITTSYPSTFTVAGKLSILLLADIALPLYFKPSTFFKLLFKSSKLNFPSLP